MPQDSPTKAGGGGGGHRPALRIVIGGEGEGSDDRRDSSSRGRSRAGSRYLSGLPSHRGGRISGDTGGGPEKAVVNGGGGGEDDDLDSMDVPGQVWQEVIRAR